MNDLSILRIALVYLVVINVVTFIMYGIDKWKAKNAKWRIRETALLGLALLGGSIGAWLGMQVWHHKTLNKKFRYGVPLILFAQIAILFLCSCRTKEHIDAVLPISGKAVQEHSPNVFLVMYDAEIGKEPLLKAIKEYKCEVKYDHVYHLQTQ